MYLHIPLTIRCIINCCSKGESEFMPIAAVTQTFFFVKAQIPCITQRKEASIKKDVYASRLTELNS